jgi:pyruvate/2-oxoacid:ferredoxin oxidoreductase beta subunit
VEVCGDHGALKMIKKTTDVLPHFSQIWEAYRRLPETPEEYVNPKLLTDIMLKEKNLGYVGGAGSCMGCGEASAIRQWIASTNDRYGNNWGIVAATGCNTVFGSTYPYNPYTVPWTNSLFENAPADAMGIRAFWDETGHADRPLWVIGGDGAMFDIGFQSLSRMLASGMNIKVLVLDTQVYSNTGGQTSTATYLGQEAKMSAFGKAEFGKTERRKELFQLVMMHPNTYVAQTVGPMINHFIRCVQRANEYRGPAVIIAYTTCQAEHGVGDDRAAAQARLAVQSRAFPLAVYDPERGETIKERLSLAGNPNVDRDWCTVKEKDGSERKVTFLDFARSETRFSKQFGKDGTPSETILNSMRERLQNWRQLQELAGIVNRDREAGKAERK